MDRVERVEKAFTKREFPDFRIGDTVRVHVRVQEAEKERIQVYEGVVIGRSGTGHRETFRVRKVSFGVGVERIFPMHSPIVEQIQVVRKGRVRRAKLYYLREKKGRSGRVAERTTLGTAPVAETPAPPPATPVTTS